MNTCMHTVHIIHINMHICAHPYVHVCAYIYVHIYKCSRGHVQSPRGHCAHAVTQIDSTLCHTGMNRETSLCSWLEYHVTH